MPKLFSTFNWKRRPSFFLKAVKFDAVGFCCITQSSWLEVLSPLCNIEGFPGSVIGV